MAFTIGTNIDDGVDLNSARSAVEHYLKMDNLTTKNNSGEVEKAEVINNSVSAPKSILDIYGIRQEIVTQSNKQDPKVTALRKLDDNCTPKEEIIVEVIGDTMYKVGYGVHVKLPFLKNYDDCFMYIKEITNEWKNNGTFISTLTLTPSRVMDEQEWTDLDESDSSSSSGGSATAKKIIALLTQQIGKPYVWGATGPDSFDCSGLMYYCYNQFSSELIDGKPIGRTTYDQVKDGKAVSTDEKEWAVGDLILPHAGHVVAYIGNGKVIQAPKHNDVVKISDYKSTWSSVYAVRRVIPEDTTSSSSDLGSIPNDYESGLSYVEGNCNTFISNLAYYGYKNLIVSLSKQYNVDPYITAGIIAIESEGNPYSGASGKYRGLMQVENGATDDEQANITQGLKDFNEKKQAISGSQIHVILSAYNSGQGTVKNACDKAGIDEATCTIKQLGDALYNYCKANPSAGDANEKKYYASKVIKAHDILLSKKVLN